MLSDKPTPSDLPDATVSSREWLGHVGPPAQPPLPYAADTPPGGPPAPAGGPSPRVLIALGLVVVLLAVTALVTWAFRPGDQPVSLPTPTSSSAATTPATPATPTPGATGPTKPVAGSYPAALAGFYTQPLDWQPCPDHQRQQCATIKVPVDYAKPTGGTFRLALRKVPALDQAGKVGSLLMNPGGPGGSGVEYAGYADYVLSKGVRNAYDAIGFDPRGIGASDAVSCLTDDRMDLFFSDDPTPDTPAERAQLIRDTNATVKSCTARGGERALHMSSAEVAKDMDIIRQLVGDPKLNFFGVSYGTFLGALYADQFPQRVGRFVLDSAMSPNQTDEQEMAYDIQGFESSIDAFIGWCVQRSDCALGQDKAAATGRLSAFLDAVEASPLRTTRPGLATIGEGWVGFSIFMSLYSDSSWGDLNKGLAQAMTQGSGDLLLNKAMSVVDRSSSGKYARGSYLQATLPVRCADWPRAPETPALKAAQAKAAQAHPLWAKLTGELYDTCADWPVPGRTPKGTTLAVGAAPILVIGNLRDPATPIGGTKQLASDLASGILVTSDHDGHGTYYAGNPCVDAIVDGYLVSGKVPSGDTAC